MFPSFRTPTAALPIRDPGARGQVDALPRYDLTRDPLSLPGLPGLPQSWAAWPTASLPSLPLALPEEGKK